MTDQRVSYTLDSTLETVDSAETTATRIAVYCDIQDDSFLRSIVEWLLDFPVSGKALRMVENGLSSGLIMTAVKKHKPLRLARTA